MLCCPSHLRGTHLSGLSLNTRAMNLGWRSSPESVPSASTMFGRRQLLRIVNSSQEGGALGTLVYNGCLLRKAQIPFQSAG